MDESAAPETFAGTRPTKKAIGKRLRQLRVAAGLNQTELGLGLGENGEDIPKASISGWEIGRNLPSIVQFTLLCQRLGTTPDQVLGLTDRDQVEAQAAQPSVVTIAQLARLLSRLPRAQRSDASELLQGLALAPDSKMVAQELGALLARGRGPDAGE
jgi:transcriptional regulator with XRE-family HTH domain